MIKFEKELYTVKEVADILLVDRITIYRRVKAGKLKAIRMPGSDKLYFSKEYLESLFKPEGKD
jgi:excisionase family DNA binding protein